MGQLGILLWVAAMFAIAWFMPAIDMEDRPFLDARVFWAAVWIGLLASAVYKAARVIWRRSRG
ncbi:MAG: hypothetical protein P4L67_04995 [Candidatus Pacebacteria bacterium]|nr:hypothetical protein [Candidatus Paceibacterota bacterium]